MKSLFIAILALSTLKCFAQVSPEGTYKVTKVVVLGESGEIRPDTRMTIASVSYQGESGFTIKMKQGSNILSQTNFRVDDVQKTFSEINRIIFDATIYTQYLKNGTGKITVLSKNGEVKYLTLSYGQNSYTECQKI